MSVLRLQEIRAKSSEFTKSTVESLGALTSRDGQLFEQISDACIQLDHLVLEDASNLLVLPTIEHLVGTVIQESLQKLVSVQPPSDWKHLHGVMDKCRSFAAWLSREYLNVTGLDATPPPTSFAQMQRDLFCVPPWIAAMLVSSRQRLLHLEDTQQGQASNLPQKPSNSLPLIQIQDNSQLQQSAMQTQQLTPDLIFSDISLCLPEECKHVLLANMISNLLEAHDYNLISTLNKLFIGKEAEDIVFSLLRFYEKQGKALNFIYHLIDVEIAKCGDHIQLFRGEEFPSRTIRIFTRLQGVEYVHECLGPIIHRLMETDTLCEVNEDEPPTEQMKFLITNLCQQFIDAIIANRSKLPQDFYKLSNYLVKQATNKFGTACAKSVISGFMFLRFFCPCITSPAQFGFKPPSKNVNTSLLLVGKVVQTIANGTVAFRDENLKFLDSFLQDNSAKISSYINSVSIWPQFDGKQQEYEILSYYFTQKKDPLCEFFRSEDDTKNHLYTGKIELNLLEMLNRVLKMVTTDNDKGNEVVVATIDKNKFPTNVNHAFVKQFYWLLFENSPLLYSFYRFIAKLSLYRTPDLKPMCFNFVYLLQKKNEEDLVQLAIHESRLFEQPNAPGDISLTFIENLFQKHLKSFFGDLLSKIIQNFAATYENNPKSNMLNISDEFLGTQNIFPESINLIFEAFMGRNFPSHFQNLFFRMSYTLSSLKMMNLFQYLSYLILPEVLLNSDAYLPPHIVNRDALTYFRNFLLHEKEVIFMPLRDVEVQFSQWMDGIVESGALGESPRNSWCPTVKPSPRTQLAAGGLRASQNVGNEGGPKGVIPPRKPQGGLSNSSSNVLGNQIGSKRLSSPASDFHAIRRPVSANAATHHQVTHPSPPEQSHHIQAQPQFESPAPENHLASPRQDVQASPTAIQQQFDSVFSSPSPAIEIRGPSTQGQSALDDAGLSPPSPRKGLKPRSRNVRTRGDDVPSPTGLNSSDGIASNDASHSAHASLSGSISSNNTQSPVTTSPSSGIAIKRGMPLRLNNNKEPVTRSLRKPNLAEIKGVPLTIMPSTSRSVAFSDSYLTVLFQFLSILLKVKRELKKVWQEHYANTLPLVLVHFHPADVINSLHPTYVPQKMPYSQYDLLKHVYERQYGKEKK